MSKKQMPLFVTQHDIVAIAKKISAERHIEFVVMGLFDKPELILCEAEKLMPFTSYLAFDKGLSIEVRPVTQRDGSMKYAIDPKENKHTMVLHCGGYIDNQRLIASDISLATDSKKGEEIYTLFFKEIREKCEKIRSYYVGPEATKLLDEGVRLSPTAKSPEAYDLTRNQ